MLASILVPVHNGAHYLEDCLSRLESPLIKETILIDDGSSDESAFIAKHFDVTLLSHATPLGPAAAINTGLSRASGEYVTIIEQDDLLVPNSLEWRVDFLNSHPNEMGILGIVGQIIDSNNNPIKKTNDLLHKKNNLLPNLIKLSYLIDGGWLPMNPLSTGLYRRCFLTKIGLLNEVLSAAADREYFYRILSQHSIPLIKKETLIRRFHSNNVSVQNEGDSFSLTPRAKAESLMIDLEYGIKHPQYN